MKLSNCYYCKEAYDNKILSDYHLINVGNLEVLQKGISQSYVGVPKLK